MISGGFGATQQLNSSAISDVGDAGRTYSKPKAVCGSKTPLLPNLSASTQEILARVQAENAASILCETSTCVDGFKVPTMSTESSSRGDSTLNTTAQIQRPRMASEIFDKSKLKSAFASALTPKSKTLPSQPLDENTNQSSSVADVSANLNSTLLSGKPPQPATELSNINSSLMKSDESTIEVIPAPAKAAAAGLTSPKADSSSKPNGEKPEIPRARMRMSHTYVLPSGEVVNSGKGLGRGRPGIKRGPRKLKSLSTPTPTLSEPKPTSRKRKHSSIDSSVKPSRGSRSPSQSVSDSGDEYAPDATQTRSGRHIQRPTTFVPPESPSHKKPRLSESASTSAGKLVIKRKVYKGKEQSALCEHCLRGYGPLKNAIVFCDGCNRCWHQKCHDPMIPRRLVLDPSSEWFCNDCAVVKAKAKKVARIPKAERPLATTETSTPIPPSSTDTARKDYFNTLTKEKLVDLLMQASTLAPHFPLWQPSPAPELPPSQPAIAPLPRPASPTKEDAYPTPKNEPSDPDDDYNEDEDEHAKLYPSPGNGVQLPPESEDLHMLLEGPDSRTFSHSLRKGVAGVGVSGI